MPLVSIHKVRFVVLLVIFLARGVQKRFQEVLSVLRRKRSNLGQRNGVG